LLEQREVKRAVFAQLVRQSGLAGGFHGEAGEFTKLQQVVRADDGRPAEAFEGFVFGLESRVVFRFARELEDHLPALTFHQQDDRDRPAAQLFEDSETAFKTVALTGFERIGPFGSGAREFLFDVVQVRQKVLDVVTETDIGIGTEGDEVFEGVHGAVECFADLQATGPAQLVLQFRLRSSGRFASEKQVGERAEGKDVQFGPAVRAAGQGFGGNEDE